MIFLKTENPFLETKFLQIFECLQTRIQKFYNLLQHEKSYSSSQPFFFKKEMLPNFWLYTFGHMWNNFDPETWCYFFRKNKQHTAIEDRKKRTLLLLYILTARLFKKKDFDPERSVTNGCFWQTKDHHAYTYCWNSWGQHLVMCLSIPRVSAAADAARLHYFFLKTSQVC